MKIGFVVERPTQFDAPFFRHAARDPAHAVEVFFTAPAPSAPVFDPELGREVSWDMDLLAGYAHRPLGSAGATLFRGLDLVVVNGYTRLPYLKAALAARRANARTALRIDSVRFGSQAVPRWRRLVFAAGLLPLFDVFLATGTLSLRHLRECGVPEARTGLFPYAVDAEDFRLRSRLTPAARSAARSKLGVAEADRVVLSLAKFSPREAPWELVRAAGTLRDPQLFWLFAGDGPLRGELIRLARRSGLERFGFPGYVPYAELPSLYAAADLFVHAPREERWGVSLAEAMACGLPVIASSRVGAAYDLVVSGRNGFTYDAGDWRSLGERIAASLQDLSKESVARENQAVLKRWGYAAAWGGVLAAAGGRA